MASGHKPCVLVTHFFGQYAMDALESKFSVLKLWEADDKQAFLSQVSGKIKGLVGSAATGVSVELIDALPDLEILSLLGVGTDAVDLDKCRERGIRVTNTPDVVTEDTADLAMALVLATMRRICAVDKYVREGLWPFKGHYPLTHRVNRKRLGIVGLGRIGRAVAKRAEGFGCKIAYHSRSRKPECGYEFYGSVVELAENSDILVVACALTKETTHIVNRDVLNALGPDGTLVNIARGSVVAEPELVKALIEGRLGAAGLDVFENEPHVPKELLSLDNVVLGTHVGTGTLAAVRDIVDLGVANLEAHFFGKPLLTPV